MEIKGDFFKGSKGVIGSSSPRVKANSFDYYDSIKAKHLALTPKSEGLINF